MVLDDSLVLMAPPLLPTPYTRLITYWVEIGLSNQQLTDIIAILKTWRSTYISRSITLFTKKNQLYALADARPINLGAMQTKCDEYTAELKLALTDYASVISQVNTILSAQQLDDLRTIYDDEKAIVPLLRPGYM